MILQLKAETGHDFSPRSPGSILFLHLVLSACCLLASEPIQEEAFHPIIFPQKIIRLKANFDFPRRKK